MAQEPSTRFSTQQTFTIAVKQVNNNYVSTFFFQVNGGTNSCGGHFPQEALRNQIT